MRNVVAVELVSPPEAAPTTVGTHVPVGFGRMRLFQRPGRAAWVWVKALGEESASERGPEHADGVFDFAAAVADPAHPGRLRDRYDSGDGLHLSEAGYRALASAVDVTRLSGSPCLTDSSPARVALSDG